MLDYYTYTLQLVAILINNLRYELRTLLNANNRIFFRYYVGTIEVLRHNICWFVTYCSKHLDLDYHTDIFMQIYLHESDHLLYSPIRLLYAVHSFVH